MPSRDNLVEKRQRRKKFGDGRSKHHCDVIRLGREHPPHHGIERHSRKRIAKQIVRNYENMLFASARRIIIFVPARRKRHEEHGGICDFATNPIYNLEYHFDYFF